jgi:hypothetical protein
VQKYRIAALYLITRIGRTIGAPNSLDASEAPGMPRLPDLVDKNRHEKSTKRLALYMAKTHLALRIYRAVRTSVGLESFGRLDSGSIINKVDRNPLANVTTTRECNIAGIGKLRFRQQS